MMVIGLTGQTGAGKTTLCDTLRARGVTVIDADVVARDVLNNSKSCLGDLVLEFGCDIIDRGGELNRKKLSAIVFRDKKKLRRLNQLTHPHIVARIEEEIARWRERGAPLVVLDAPTLYEAGCDRLCNFVVALTAPEEERARRIMSRDGLSPDEAADRIHSQHDDAFYQKRAAFVIENGGPPELLIERMDEILRSVSREAAGV